MNRNNKRQFYFSLFRVIALLRGGNARRAESNGFEALLVGLLMYAIHYLFFAALLVPPHLEPWLRALFLVALAFWVWLFWLLFLYLNSLIVTALHRGGFFRTIPTRRVQSVLWGIATSAMACELLRGSPVPRELGALWLVAVTMNLVAAMVLAFSDAARSPGK